MARTKSWLEMCKEADPDFNADVVGYEFDQGKRKFKDPKAPFYAKDTFVQDNPPVE